MGITLFPQSSNANAAAAENAQLVAVQHRLRLAQAMIAQFEQQRNALRHMPNRTPEDEQQLHHLELELPRLRQGYLAAEAAIVAAADRVHRLTRP